MKKSKLITMAISLLAAICLWIYVVTVVNPEGTTTISNIPVTFSGAEVLREDQGLVLSGDYQDMVTVSFTGKNSDMKKLEQNKEEISAVIDVSKIRSTRDYTLSYDLLLPDAVPDSAVTITDRTPGNITVHVEKLVKKPVPVKGDFSQVEVAEGYMLDSTTFDYDTVTVEGAESVVDQIEYALISMNRTNVDKTISEQLDYTLVDANGEAVDTSELTMDVQAIDVTLTVVMYKEVQSGRQVHRRRRRDVERRVVHDRPGDDHTLRRRDGTRGCQYDPARQHRPVCNHEERGYGAAADHHSEQRDKRLRRTGGEDHAPHQEQGDLDDPFVEYHVHRCD